MEKQITGHTNIPSTERTLLGRLPEVMSIRARRLSSFMLDKLSVKRPNLDADRMKEKGYVCTLGRTAKNLMQERPYTGMIRHDAFRTESARGSVDKERVRDTPEDEAVSRTKQFLESYIETVSSDDGASGVASALAGKARYILEYMTYMTEQDLNQASEGLSHYWKGYLDENSQNQIVIIAKQQKSSGYVATKALSFLADTDRDRVECTEALSFYDDQTGRNLAEDEGWLEDYTAHRKIIMVDDWVSTGRQVSHEYGRVLRALPWNSDPAKHEARRQLLIDHSEINLLVDSERRISQGLALNGDGMVDGIRLPIKAYWAKEGVDTMTADLYGQQVEAGLLVTGSHSSTDDYFEVPCAQMLGVLHDEYGVMAAMPPLANIQRPYRKL